MVWINLHGGAIFGLAVVGWMVAVRLAVERLGRERWSLRTGAGRDALIGLACVAATLINPFGLSALLYPFRLALGGSSASRKHIYEWTSPFVAGGIRSPLYEWAIAAGVAALVVLVVRGAWRRPDGRAHLVAFGFFLATLAMSVQSRRFIPLFALATALLVAPCLASFVPANPALRRWSTVAVFGAALMFAALRLAPYPWTSRAFPALTREHRMPIAALDFMEANGIRGKTFNYFLWGGYIDYRTDGDVPVFIDPRSETVFSDETQSAYYRVRFFARGWEEILDGSGADLLLWPADSDEFARHVARFVATGRWWIVYRGARAFLLARTGFTLPSTLTYPSTPHQSWTDGRLAMRAKQYSLAEEKLRSALNSGPRCDRPARISCCWPPRPGSRPKLLATARRCQAIFPDRKQLEEQRRLAAQIR